MICNGLKRRPRHPSTTPTKPADTRSSFRIPTLSKHQQRSAPAAESAARPVQTPATSVQTPVLRAQHSTAKTQSRSLPARPSTSSLQSDVTPTATRTVTFTEATKKGVRKAQPLDQQGPPSRHGSGVFSLISTDTGLSTTSSQHSALEWQMAEEMTGYKRNTHSRASPGYYYRKLRNAHIQRKESW